MAASVGSKIKLTVNVLDNLSGQPGRLTEFRSAGDLLAPPSWYVLFDSGKETYVFEDEFEVMSGSHIQSFQKEE